LMLFWLEKL